jgi:hypothetical protein
MFELTGDNPGVAAAEAKTVLTVETGLAQASMDDNGSPKVTSLIGHFSRFSCGAVFWMSRSNHSPF